MSTGNYETIQETMKVNVKGKLHCFLFKEVDDPMNWYRRHFDGERGERSNS